MTPALLPVAASLVFILRLGDAWACEADHVHEAPSLLSEQLEQGRTRVSLAHTYTRWRISQAESDWTYLNRLSLGVSHRLDGPRTPAFDHAIRFNLNAEHRRLQWQETELTHRGFGDVVLGYQVQRTWERWRLGLDQSLTAPLRGDSPLAEQLRIPHDIELGSGYFAYSPSLFGAYDTELGAWMFNLQSQWFLQEPRDLRPRQNRHAWGVGWRSPMVGNVQAELRWQQQHLSTEVPASAAQESGGKGHRVEAQLRASLATLECSAVLGLPFAQNYRDGTASGPSFGVAVSTFVGR